MSIVDHFSTQIATASALTMADGPSDVVLLLPPDDASPSACEEALRQLRAANTIADYASIPPAVQGHPCSFLVLRPCHQTRAGASDNQG